MTAPFDFAHTNALRSGLKGPLWGVLGRHLFWRSDLSEKGKVKSKK